MRQIGRNLFLILTLILIALAFSSCGKEEQTLTDEEGNILQYQKWEIRQNGFYVHDKKTDLFYPVMSGFSGYEDPPAKNTSIGMDEFLMESDKGQVRHIWMSDQLIEPLDILPVVDGKRTELILWYQEEDSMPEEFTLEKYRRLPGYTIGAHISFGETGTSLYITKEDACEASDAEETLSRYSDGLLKINRIQESKALPIDNVDPEVNMLLGLEKDKKYKIAFFDGTQYEEADFLADTIAFKSQKLIELSSPYEITEDNYFVINLPQNLKSGYYYINSNGLFGFKADEQVIEEEED